MEFAVSVSYLREKFRSAVLQLDRVLCLECWFPSRLSGHSELVLIKSDGLSLVCMTWCVLSGLSDSMKCDSMLLWSVSLKFKIRNDLLYTSDGGWLLVMYSFYLMTQYWQIPGAQLAELCSWMTVWVGMH